MDKDQNRLWLKMKYRINIMHYLKRWKMMFNWIKLWKLGPPLLFNKDYKNIINLSYLINKGSKSMVFIKKNHALRNSRSHPPKIQLKMLIFRGLVQILIIIPLKNWNSQWDQLSHRNLKSNVVISLNNLIQQVTPLTRKYPWETKDFHHKYSSILICKDLI